MGQGADVDTPLDQLQIQMAQRRAAEARAEAAMLVETIEERALEVSSSSPNALCMHPSDDALQAALILTAA